MSLYEIDSTKEAWLKNRLKQMSIADLDKFFRYASVCLGHRSKAFEKDSKEKVTLCFNRIDPSLLYRRNVEIESTRDRNGLTALRDALNVADGEMNFFIEKAELLYYIEPGKRKRKKLLAKWLAYDPQISNFKKLYSSKRVRPDLLRLSGCRAIRKEAARYLKWWRKVQRDGEEEKNLCK